MKKQRVAVTWKMLGYIEVEADSLEEAMDKVNDNLDYYSFPYDSVYVDGTFDLASTDMEIMRFYADKADKYADKTEV